MFYSYNAFNSGGSYIEEVSTKLNRTSFALSSSVILVYTLMWVKFYYSGFALDEFSSIYDLITMGFLFISCVYSFLSPLLFLDYYGWGVSVKFTSLIVTLMGVISLTYVLNIENHDNISNFSSQNITATVVSKGTWSKKSSLVLSTEEDVLTYDNVLNYRDIEVGYHVTSVSESELTRTYTDLFGHDTKRHLKGVMLEGGYFNEEE